MKMKIGTIIPCVGIRSLNVSTVADSWDAYTNYIGNSIWNDYGVKPRAGSRTISEICDEQYSIGYFELEVIDIQNVTNGYSEEKNCVGYILKVVGKDDGVRYVYNYPIADRSSVAFDVLSASLGSLEEYEKDKSNGYYPVLHPCSYVMLNIQDWLNVNCSKSDIHEDAKVLFDSRILAISELLSENGWSWSWESVFQEHAKKTKSFRGVGICHYRIYKEEK